MKSKNVTPGEGLSHEEYMEKLKSLIPILDPSDIDFEDERTRYILRGTKLLEEYDKTKGK